MQTMTYEPYLPIGKNVVRINGVRVWLPTGHIARGYGVFGERRPARAA